MGKQPIIERCRELAGAIGWRLFLRGYSMTEEAYFESKYQDEKSYRISMGLPL